MGELYVAGQSGHTTTNWDPKKPIEVKAASEQFEQLVKKSKFRAYRIDKKGEPGVEITEFDPNLASIIIVPPVAGGC